jgi:hypothetical protein
MGLEGAVALADGLHENSCLEELHLRGLGSREGLSAEAAQQLAHRLREKPPAESLRLLQLDRGLELGSPIHDLGLPSAAKIWDDSAVLALFRQEHAAAASGSGERFAGSPAPSEEAAARQGVSPDGGRGCTREAQSCVRALEERARRAEQENTALRADAAAQLAQAAAVSRSVGLLESRLRVVEGVLWLAARRAGVKLEAEVAASHGDDDTPCCTPEGSPRLIIGAQGIREGRGWGGETAFLSGGAASPNRVLTADQLAMCSIYSRAAVDYRSMSCAPASWYHRPNAGNTTHLAQDPALPAAQKSPQTNTELPEPPHHDSCPAQEVGEDRAGADAAAARWKACMLVLMALVSRAPGSSSSAADCACVRVGVRTGVRACSEQACRCLWSHDAALRLPETSYHTLSAPGQTCLLAALALDDMLLGSHPHMHELRSAFIHLPISVSLPASASAPSRNSRSSSTHPPSNSWYQSLMTSKEAAVLAGPRGAVGEGRLGSPGAGGHDRVHGGSGKSW